MHYYARSVPDLRSYRNELGTRPGKLGWLFARFVVLGSMARITELPNVLTSDIDKCDSSVSLPQHVCAGKIAIVYV